MSEEELEMLDACKAFWEARRSRYENINHESGSTRKNKKRLYDAMAKLWGPISEDLTIMFEREAAKRKFK